MKSLIERDMGRIGRVFWGGLPGLVLTLGLGFGGKAHAWTRPGLPSQSAKKGPTESMAELDYVVIQVNGIRRVIKAGEETSIVRGDQVTVDEAYLRDPHRKVEAVTVVGLSQTRNGGPDARGTSFRTADLASKLSERGQKQVYAILVQSGAVRHGVVYLRIHEIALRFAEVRINGDRRVLRDGEVLALRAQDSFKMERIVTNLSSHDDVIFQIAETGGHQAIRLWRGGLPFATIPLVILKE